MKVGTAWNGIGNELSGYRIRFNFRGVKLSRIADFSNFRVFIFADAGS